MLKLILILLPGMVLTGCTTMFPANIKNESTGHIVVIPPFESEYRVEIGENETERASWYQECITVIDGDKKLFFRGWPVPSNVMQTHIFSTSLNVRYKEGSLYFENREGELYPIKQLSGCGKR